MLSAGGKLTSALLALVQKGNAKPGSSWRVGVGTAVAEENNGPQPTDALSLRRALLHPTHTERKVQSAVMTVSHSSLTCLLTYEALLQCMTQFS
jgi:hypothetical protein